MLRLWRSSCVRASNVLATTSIQTSFYAKEASPRKQAKRTKNYIGSMLFTDSAAKYRKRVATSKRNIIIANERRTEEQAEAKREKEKIKREEKKSGLDELKVSFAERHTVVILYRYFERLQTAPNAALDSFVSDYLNKTNGIGMHNRHAITNTVYDMVRWHLVLQYIVQHGGKQHEATLEDLRKQQRVHVRNTLKVLHNAKIELEQKMKKLTREKKHYSGVKHKRHLDTHLGSHALDEAQIEDKRSEAFLDKNIQEEIVQWRLKYHLYLAIKPRLTALTTVGSVKSLQERLSHKFADYQDDPSMMSHITPHFSLEESAMQLYDAPLNIVTGCPSELFDLLVEDYGQDKAIEMCLINNTQAPIFARINPAKVPDRQKFVDHMLLKYGPQTKQSLAEFNALDSKQKEIRREEKKIMQLEREGITLCTKSALGLRFTKRQNFRALEEYKQGLFEIQDEASQLVSSLMKVRPGMQVMDYCCGAGGKTLAFAHLMNGKGVIHMVDIREKILLEAKKRLRRAGFENIMPLHTEHKHLPKLVGKMQYMLVDVPCTGTGTIRRNPELRFKVTRAWVDRLVKEQRTIFEDAIKYLRNDGVIIYATCSVLKRENENQITHLTKRFGLEVIETFKVLPAIGEHDGMFACVMKYANKK